MNQTIQPFGLIYKITNLQTKKIYIGQTTHIDNFKYYWGSGIKIRHAVKKNNKKFFKKEILGYCYSQEELDECEKECINFFDSQNQIYGYNISAGGGQKHDRPHSLESKLKMSKSLKGKCRPHTKNTKDQISKTLRGHSVSNETKEKISKTLKGRKLSEQHKLNIKLSNKNKVEELHGFLI